MQDHSKGRKVNTVDHIVENNASIFVSTLVLVDIRLVRARFWALPFEVVFFELVLLTGRPLVGDLGWLS